MPARTYWLNLFSIKTWEEFLAAGGEVSGFRQNRWTTVRQLKPGDYLLCYLTRVSRFVGLLEVVSDPYQDSTPIWEDEEFPCRVRVRIIVALTPDTAVPIHDLRDRLSIFQNRQNPHAWSGHVRGSLTRWRAQDGEAIVEALRAAEASPVRRPVPGAAVESLKSITVDDEACLDVADAEPDEAPELPVTLEREATAHDEIQWLLLKLGNDMGLDVWVARNDRGKSFNGRRFADLPRLRAELPLQFDAETNRTIALIDVLWLQQHSIIAAFEIESTTSIYSGLLRMSDLLAMQPNINIQLYIVAPDERRQKVFAEVERPTFSRRTPPLSDVCRYLSFSTLRDEVRRVGAYARYLKPDFIESLAEVCVQDETD